MGTEEFERGTGRAANIKRAGRMVLHPLAEVGIGMFVSVRISGSQLMMDVLGDCKRGQCQKKQDEAYRKPAREERMTHGVWPLTIIRLQSLSKSANKRASSPIFPYVMHAHVDFS